MLENKKRPSVQNILEANAGLPEPESIDHFDIRAILGILRRRRWTIVSTFVFGVTMALLVTTQLTKKYTAEALVVVDRRDSQLVGFDAGFSQGFGSSVIVDTEVEIARSSKVLERVAIELDIANAPEFHERRSWLDLIGLGDDGETQDSVVVTYSGLANQDRAAVIEQLSRTVEINRRGLTNVISLEATALTANDAASRANALANAYLEEQIASRLNSTGNAVAFLQSRVENLERDITSGELAIETFVTEKLRDLGSPAARELLQRIQRESTVRQADAKALSEIQEALNRQDAVALARLAESQQADLAGQRQALAQELASTGSEAAKEQARRRLEALDLEIKEASQRRIESIKVDMALSEGRTANFRRQLETSLTDMQLPKEVGAELVRLQRDVETQRTLYDNFLAKLRQVEQQTDFNLPDSRIIADAAPPSKPSFPPTLLILAGSIVFSLGAGIMLAFLRETYIGGVTSVEQFENLAGIPVFATLPKITGSNIQPDTMIVEHPLSAFSEGVRRLRIGIDSLGIQGPRTLFVTSNLPGEGKTTLGLALARHFALTGSSTILIDADLRHPSVHRSLKTEAGEDLVEFLSRANGEVADQLTIAKEEATNLNIVLGAQDSMVATDALLMSRKFGDLMDFARETYDIVIVDTPPVGLFVDAAIVAAHCDIGVFIAQYATTTPQQIRTCVRELTRTGAATLCGVLNKVAEADIRSYGYGRKYYQYYGSGS